MAGVVVVVMLSVLLPMFSMYGTIDENSTSIITNIFKNIANSDLMKGIFLK